MSRFVLCVSLAFGQLLSSVVRLWEGDGWKGVLHFPHQFACIVSAVKEDEDPGRSFTISKDDAVRDAKLKVIHLAIHIHSAHSN